MELKSHRLTTCEVTTDGQLILLGLADAAGDAATIGLSTDQAGALGMTLPGLIEQARRKKFGDRALCFADRLASRQYNALPIRKRE